MAQNIFNRPDLNSTKTSIIAILDRSGSMSKQIVEAIGGFNAFVEEQKRLPGDARLTLVIFDNFIDVLYTDKPITEVQPLSSEVFYARGGTHLYDAIGNTINSYEDGWADTTVVCILTDGADMYSKEYTKDDIAAIIQAKEAEGWTFVFMAANQDAFSESQSMGMNVAGVSIYSANVQGATQSAYRAASTAVGNTRMLSAGARSISGQSVSLFDRSALETALYDYQHPNGDIGVSDLPEPANQGTMST